MDIGVGLDPSLNLSFDDQADLSQEAARLGYTSIWTPEGTGHDSFQLCAQRWAASRQVAPEGLNTGIAVSPVMYRTPVAFAMAEDGGAESLHRAMAGDLGLDLARSYVVGDRATDVELAARIGAGGILVLTGYGRGAWSWNGPRWPSQPDAVVEDLSEAARWVRHDLGLEAD